MTAAAPRPLNDRARGWLRHLWRKATTPDDWSKSGDPHPWWDRKSVEPMLSFPRFDLSESSYAMLLMARRTPAWREVYTRILDELLQRHTTFWAAVDWLTQIGSDRSFVTTAEDHANCSVGSYTHGWISLEEAATRDDVEAVLAAGWVDEAAMRALPSVTRRPHRIVYGPLATCTRAPEVVLLRVNGLGMMSLRSALPDLAIEGKPQCHIVPLALERGIAAASVGCALSRARTGMRADEMTAALPGAALDSIVAALEATVALDRDMARYAADDAKRFD